MKTPLHRILLAIILVSMLSIGALTTSAYWVDANARVTGNASIGTIPKVSISRCIPRDQSMFSIGLVWLRPVAPSPLAQTFAIREIPDARYTLLAVGGNYSMSANDRLVPFTDGTYHLDITTTLPGTDWTSLTTQVVEYNSATGFTCGAIT